jgi:hypothetical protein
VYTSRSWEEDRLMVPAGRAWYEKEWHAVGSSSVGSSDDSFMVNQVLVCSSLCCLCERERRFLDLGGHEHKSLWRDGGNNDVDSTLVRVLL